MKTVFLNVWHATRKDELTYFIDQQKLTTDIFCFMEADATTREYLRKLLPSYAEHAATKNVGKRGPIDVALYIKDSLEVVSTQTLLQDEPNTGLALLAYVKQGEQTFAVVSVHGISFDGDTKLDTTSRLVQSRTIIETLQDSAAPTLIGGDFNLLPETESIALFARAGYQNLVTEYAIETTRNRLAWERYPQTIQYYADYVFASPDVQVDTFEVPRNEVSDHLPLIVEATLLPDSSYALQGSAKSSAYTSV